MSEQERLARMLGGFDPSEAPDLIVNHLRSALGSVSKDTFEKVQEEIDMANATSGKRPVQGLYKSDREIKPQASNVNMENLLLALCDVYDGLISVFQGIGINHSTSDELTKIIHNVESCISKVGGSVDHFIPEDFVSGLDAPDQHRSAEKVIETTMQCYKLGTIDSAKIENEDVISITFSGTGYDGVTYSAKGLIKPLENGWIGNEAIDYVYKPNGGKMTVRAFEDGKWINKSSSYDIYYEVDVPEAPQAQAPQENEPPAIEDTGSPEASKIN